MRGPAERLHRRSGDVVLFGTVLAMLAIGLVMVYSASSVAAHEHLRDSAYYLKRQAAWIALGLAAMCVVQAIHYRRLARWAAPALALAAVLLVAVLLPGVGRVAGGARRWIALGPAAFQPVEFAKLALVLFLAQFAARRGLRIREFRAGVLPPLLIAGGLAVLVLRQPNMGSALLLVGVAGTVLFLAGARVWHLVGIAAAGLPVLAAAVYVAPYRLQRVLAFLDPWSDPQGRGFHVIQSLLAFGSGGLFGVGLGGSGQKFYYLPERHTDFIFAILGEELGLVGTGGLLVLLAIFCARGVRIARGAPDRFGALLAAGITATIAGQALLNMSMTTGLLPVAGLPLPFVSFGGSSLVTTLAQVGILFNISQYAHRGDPAAARPAPPVGAAS